MHHIFWICHVLILEAEYHPSSQLFSTIFLVFEPLGRPCFGGFWNIWKLGGTSACCMNNEAETTCEDKGEVGELNISVELMSSNRECPNPKAMCRIRERESMGPKISMILYLH